METDSFSALNLTTSNYPLHLLPYHICSALQKNASYVRNSNTTTNVNTVEEISHSESLELLLFKQIFTANSLQNILMLLFFMLSVVVFYALNIE